MPGYPTRLFIDAPPDSSLCGICEEVLRSARQCAQGHLYCEGCIEEGCHSEGPGQSAPLLCSAQGCNCELLSAALLEANSAVEDLIGEMTVRCPSRIAAKSIKDTVAVSALGGGSELACASPCDWVGRVQDLQTHVDHECKSKHHHTTVENISTGINNCVKISILDSSHQSGRDHISSETLPQLLNMPPLHPAAPAEMTESRVRDLSNSISTTTVLQTQVKSVADKHSKVSDHSFFEKDCCAIKSSKHHTIVTGSSSATGANSATSATSATGPSINCSCSAGTLSTNHVVIAAIKDAIELLNKRSEIGQQDTEAIKSMLSALLKQATAHKVSVANVENEAGKPTERTTGKTVSPLVLDEAAIRSQLLSPSLIASWADLPCEESRAVLMKEISREKKIPGEAWSTHHLAHEFLFPSTRIGSSSGGGCTGFQMVSPERGLGAGVRGCIVLQQRQGSSNVGCYVHLRGFRGTAEITVTAFRFGRGAPQQLTMVKSWAGDESFGTDGFIAGIARPGRGWPIAGGSKVCILVTLLLLKIDGTDRLSESK